MTISGANGSRKWKRDALALALSFGASVVACVGPSQATENGTTQWPLGVQTIVSALVPPPGATEFYNYSIGINAPSFTNSSGRSSVPGFHTTVAADAGRIVHTWETQISGFNFSSGLVLAGNYLHVNVPGASGSVFGMNYAYVTPLYITYRIGDFNLLYGPSFFLPIGNYRTSQVVNATYGYYSFNQEFAVTWFPTKQLEISVESELTLNGANNVTNYHSGGDINTDFAINYALFPSVQQLKLGVQGFYANQFQNDTLNGLTVGDGNRLEKFAFGPQAVYFFNPATAVAVKWQHEFYARNTTKGDRYWVEFALPLGGSPPAAPVVAAKY